MYVKNFSQDPDFTDEQLTEMFSEYGDVQNACVMRDQNGKSKGFGFVSFVNPECAEKATQAVYAQAMKSSEDETDVPKLFCCEAKSKS